jgi:hypothetical protein
MDLAMRVGKFESGLQAAVAEIKGELKSGLSELNGKISGLDGKISGLEKSIGHIWTVLAIIGAFLIAIEVQLFSLNGSVKALEMQSTPKATMAQPSNALTMPPARQAPAPTAETSSWSESVSAPSETSGVEGGMGS